MMSAFTDLTSMSLTLYYVVTRKPTCASSCIAGTEPYVPCTVLQLGVVHKGRPQLGGEGVGSDVDKCRQGGGGS